ncbi:hypothetical protein FOQG_16136 [Fusarium oxysporum f. sp. raphani 54005]|uniref:Uncharacterized protein n=2 Tax=Fusarium oxysporum f. sp. raphani TaxID=96318 RepID=X0BAS9_FUSOX|nr:hypothetical protein FOQG_16136 [Fusarium oxysporum f. sp. raphani 54005]
MTALHPDFKTSPEIQESIGHANRSAHIWGVGLWEACKESRDVIATHFQLKLWGGIQDEGLGPLDVDESLSKACQLYPRYVKFLSDTEGEDMPGTGSDDRDAVHDRKLCLPTCPFPQHEDHADRFMVTPTRDVFSIKNIILSSLPVSLRPLAFTSRDPLASTLSSGTLSISPSSLTPAGTTNYPVPGVN